MIPRFEEKTPIIRNNATFEAFDGNKKWIMNREE